MATKQASGRPAFVRVEDFLAEVRGNVKTAEANTEPGSQGGPTTHPVKSVEDNTRDATEGARSAENTKDVKGDQGKPSVDSTPEASAKKAAAKQAGGPGAEDHLQLGTTVAATGEDPENETNKAKPGKDDPGSSHPARTDNTALDGMKYAQSLQEVPLEKLAESLQDIGNSICADLVAQGVETDATKQAQAGDKPNTQQQQPTTKLASVDPALAQQVGWQMAGILTGTLDKKASDAMVVDTIAGIIKAGEDDADRVAGWLNDYFHTKNAQQKRGEGPPMMPPGGGGGGGGGDAAMAAALGGGGAPGGMEDPAAAGAGGGAPGGGAPGGGAPGGGGGGGLQEMLAQLGISEEELMAAIEEEAAQGGMGQGQGAPPPPPGGGGAMPGAGAAPAGASPGGGPGAGMEVAAGDRSGKASPPTKEAVASYVREVVGRSRAQKAAAAAK